MARHLGVLALAIGVVLAFPAAALAAEWPWPVNGPVALEYGRIWVDGAGRSCTHRGMDLLADAGSPVTSCTDGVVVFSGAVPGAGGGTVQAVTVQAADGLRVTYMPLSSSGLRSGIELAPGDSVGRLAPDGDGSHPRSHLHLSVRRGDASLDPASFLGQRPGLGVVPAAPRTSLPERSGSSAGGERPAPTPVAPPEAEVAPSRAQLPVAAPQGASQLVPSPVKESRASGADGVAVTSPNPATEPQPAGERADARAGAPAGGGAGRLPVLSGLRLPVSIDRGLAIRCALALLAGLLMLPVLRAGGAVTRAPVLVTEDRQTRA